MEKPLNPVNKSKFLGANGIAKVGANRIAKAIRRDHQADTRSDHDDKDLERKIASIFPLQSPYKKEEEEEEEGDADAPHCHLPDPQTDHEEPDPRLVDIRAGLANVKAALPDVRMELADVKARIWARPAPAKAPRRGRR